MIKFVKNALLLIVLRVLGMRHCVLIAMLAMD